MSDIVAVVALVVALVGFLLWTFWQIKKNFEHFREYPCGAEIQVTCTSFDDARRLKRMLGMGSVTKNILSVRYDVRNEVHAQEIVASLQEKVSLRPVTLANVYERRWGE